MLTYRCVSVVMCIACPCPLYVCVCVWVCVGVGKCMCLEVSMKIDHASLCIDQRHNVVYL